MEFLVIVLIVFTIVASSAAHGYFGEQREVKERRRTKELLDQRDEAFRQGFCIGRRWLSEFIADARQASDERLENYLRTKRRPAYKAAQVARQVKTEKRELVLEHDLGLELTRDFITPALRTALDRVEWE